MGRLCNIFTKAVEDPDQPNNAMIIGVVIGVVLLLSKSFIMPGSLVTDVW